MELLHCLRSSIHSTSYVLLLKTCMASKTPSFARQVYAHLLQFSSGVTCLLADYLAVTFAKCGATEDASALFKSLRRRTVLSWTAMITALGDCGRGEDALQMFQLMQEDGVEPDSYTFVSLFKACCLSKNLQEGMRLHVAAYERGLTSNVFVGNTLLNMYTKCGDTPKAHKVFRSLPRQSIASWNGILSTLMEEGLAEDVLLSFRQLWAELGDPDHISLILALQACSSLAKVSLKNEDPNTHHLLEIGHSLHSFARNKVYESDLLVGTALINMYGSCGLANHAIQVFECLPQRDIVSFNAVLSAFIQGNQEERALQLYTWMGKEGLSPDQSTFILLFQVCWSFTDRIDTLSLNETNFVDVGQALHLDACKQGLEDTVSVVNSAILMYGKHGALFDAEYLFRSVDERNIMSWSNLLQVYVEQGWGEKGLLLYRQMQEEKVIPDSHVFVLVLQACAAFLQGEIPLMEREDSVKDFCYNMGQAIFMDAYMCGFSLDSYIGNVLIHMYSKCLGLLEAEEMFLYLPERDTITWTTMLSSYLEHGQASRVLQLYPLMLEDHVYPNELTFVITLNACSIIAECEKRLSMVENSWKLMVLEIVHALQCDANRIGCTSGGSIHSALIFAYGRCGSLVEAESLFVMPSHDYIAVMNAMIFVYVENGLEKKAMYLYEVMRKCHAHINEFILMCLMHSCRVSADLEACRDLHFDALASGHGENIYLRTNIIHAYGNCASLEDMEAASIEIVRPDTACWTACIMGSAVLGDFIAAVALLENLKLIGIQPDGVTLSALLLSCANCGCTDEGFQYCFSLIKDNDIIFNLKHYGILMGLLGRAGNLSMVEDILSRMPVQIDGMLWSSLLGLCYIHGDVGLARKAFTQALLEEQMGASTCVSMSNICYSYEKGEETAETE
ncbi:hypothetical protein KP509_12G021700 [Ceratopteris richardii]|nr:hypothetical protein KP509_12G021700 [Ceratopteris richardii]